MRFPGDAIYNLFRALPKATSSALSASTLDAPRQEENDRNPNASMYEERDPIGLFGVKNT